MMPRPLENRIQPIKLSESATKRLADRIREMIEEAEEFHSDWEDLHEEYMNMYLCVPKSEVKTYPWPNSSNLFLPLTRVITDGILAQEHDAMFANDPTVKVASIAGHGLDSSEALSQFYGEYVYKNVIPLKTIAADHMFDNTVDGTAVMRPRWSRDRRLERTMSVSYEPRTRRIETELMGVKAIAEVPDEPQAVSIEEVREVSEERPYVDCCDLSRIMVAPDTHGSMQWPYCRWYYQESELTWEDLQARRRVGYDGIDDELRVAMSNRDIGDVERAELAAQGLTESQATKTAKVLEIYMRWPLPTSYSDRNGKTVEQAEDAEDAAEHAGRQFGDLRLVQILVGAFGQHDGVDQHALARRDREAASPSTSPSSTRSRCGSPNAAPPWKRSPRFSATPAARSPPSARSSSSPSALTARRPPRSARRGRSPSASTGSCTVCRRRTRWRTTRSCSGRA